eukprot:gnl/TRDRNA2_/TRDRNA2_203549_c0_seq1.p1 gnl/TRDRNA2_/TRDRNA2_203549_c0~~gnl/TRDRNA2_/TRDRNA2_203549_c0_seq1.p1  ORF type:complete len:166 (+),score=27.75 gnl/TRDRNA2_/TRDRNA2_203549_c0_seq1:90-587(+)
MGCQSSSPSLRGAANEIEQKKYKVKDENYPGGTRDVSKLQESIDRSVLCERRTRFKERSLEASTVWKESSSTTSTTPTTDSDPFQLVSSNTSDVSDVPSLKAQGTKGITQLEILLEPQSDWEIFMDMDTPTRMNMTSFLRITTPEAADGVIVSDVVACETKLRGP